MWCHHKNYIVILCSTHKKQILFYSVCNWVFLSQAGSHNQVCQQKKKKKKSKKTALSFLKGKTTVTVYLWITGFSLSISQTYYFEGGMLCSNICRITILSKENEMCYSAIQPGLGHTGCVFNIWLQCTVWAWANHVLCMQCFFFFFLINWKHFFFKCLLIIMISF